MQAVEGASRRAYAIHAARLAHAHALAGDRDEACRSAVAALEAADIVESATARSELRRLRPVLVDRWPNRSDVREVADCLPAGV
jgi:ornithine cyclodeaminase/alanine dehydrogenase-like protein (mu-crystallin family)